jgi:alpha-glucosidase
MKIRPMQRPVQSRQLSMRLSLFVLSLLVHPAIAQNSKGLHDPIGVKVKVVTLRDGFEINSPDRSMHVSVASEGVFRIQMSATSRIESNPSWAVVSLPGPGSPVKLEITAQSVAVTSDGATLKVDRKTMAVTLLDPQNRVVNQDDPARLPEFRGTAFRIYKLMPESEHFFGLGDKTGPTDHRDQAYTMWNTDAYHWQEATDPLYKSIPFFLSMHDGLSYGIFLDDTWRSSFDFGKESRTSYSFGAENGALDYYIIYGAQPKDVVRRYTALTGRPAMPPRWALGYQQSRWSYYPESRVLEVAKRLRDDKIPADVLYLDIDYQDRNRVFTIDRTRFPHFEKMIADLAAEHFHVITITDLHIANTPKGEYSVFDSGMAGDHFMRNADGSVYVGAVWPGPSSFPEFTQASSRAWWGKQYTDFYVKDKIGGFWNDMNEPSVFTLPTKTIPLNVLHRIEEPGWPTRTATHAEIHNVMGMLNSRGTYEGLLNLLPNQRPFVLTRASYAGGQRYAATWTGDNSATWNHLRIGTHQLINLGLSGFAFSGNDVGGYAGSPSMDLLTRWLEIAAFAPIDRDHTEKGTADQEPWVGGAEMEAIRKRYIEERYRLMPYIYSLAEQASREGIPLMRPLFLEFPRGRSDNAPMDSFYDNQFMLGPSLMVAPPPFEEVQDGYNVWFPENTAWFDYWSGERIAIQHPADDSTAPLVFHEKHLDISNLPVFVRAGSILPRQPLVQSTDEVPNGPLELRVYLPQVDNTDGQPQAAVYSVRCEGTLYTDDGETFDFREGQYYRASATCLRNSQQITVQMSEAEGQYKPWWKELDIVILGEDKKPSNVLLNGTALASSASSYDSLKGTVHIRIPATFSAWTLTLQQ